MRYFEKIALTALKARNLAKSFNVIPEPGTAWKWAVRNLRKGKDIGKTPEGLIKQLKKTSKKDEYGALYGKNIKKKKLGRIVEGEGPTTDIFRTLKDDRNVNAILLKMQGSKTDKLVKDFNKKFSGVSSIHTHPKGLIRSTHKQIRDDYKIRIRAGSDILKGKGPYDIKGMLRMQKTTNPKATREDVIKTLNERIQINKAGLERSKYIKKSKIGGAIPSGWDPVKKALNMEMGQAMGDIGAYKLHSPTKTHAILSGEVLGLHKMKGADKLRSVYLKV